MSTLYDPLCAALVGGLIGAIGTWVAVVYQGRLNAKADQLAMKRDVFRRLVANRFVLTRAYPDTILQNGEPFVSLNEAFVVFARDLDVIAALKNVHPVLGSGPGEDNLVTLIKSMATACDIPYDLNDSFIVQPFTPKVP